MSKSVFMERVCCLRFVKVSESNIDKKNLNRSYIINVMIYHDSQL